MILRLLKETVIGTAEDHVLDFRDADRGRRQEGVPETLFSSSD
jgi:hypothetical protein